MRLINLEDVVPGLGAARAAERLNRALSFAGLTCSLAGLECVQLTPRHRLEFQLAGNAFAIGLRPLRGDVFQFLWRLNPAWRKGQPITLSSTLAWLKVKRVVKRGNLTLVRSLEEFLVAMLQDLPEGEDGPESANPPGDYVHWMAVEAGFYMRVYHMGLREYQETPYLVLQQLYRSCRLAHEKGVTFINASDRLVSEWQRAMTPKNNSREN